jgi:hypothetical protein
VQTYIAFNNLHQCRLANIRHDLGIEFAVSFVDAEDDGFARSAATAPASHITRAEVGFIQFDFARERRSVFA